MRDWLARVALHVRWPNLLLLAAIQALVYVRLVREPEMAFRDHSLGLLILATVLAGAAGYVINDLCDESIDRINKPERWWSGRAMPVRALWQLFWLLVVSGAAITLWVACQYRLMSWSFLYVAAIGGLWAYSIRLKCTPLLGNLWVACFATAAVLLVALPGWLNGHAASGQGHLWSYAGFAFLTTLYRELVKDLEDVKGDEWVGCRTLVVACGIRKARRIAGAVGFVLLVSLVAWSVRLAQAGIWFFAIGLPALALYTLLRLQAGEGAATYHGVSRWIKFIMLAGTLVLFWL